MMLYMALTDLNVVRKSRNTTRLVVQINDLSKGENNIGTFEPPGHMWITEGLARDR